MKVSSYECDCGKRKGEANRWILGRNAVHGYYDDGDLVKEFDYIGISAWNEEEAEEIGVKHFCSEACALKWQMRELERMGR